MFRWIKRKHHPSCFGLLAEFTGSDELLDAVKKTRADGYEELEAYTPIPMHEISHALGLKNDLPLLVLAGGILGAVGGFALQYYASVIDYPVNVGGRPNNSWPSFIVITFETTILCAALTAVLGMLALNGLPRPHHPVFSVPRFEQASRDRFFLLIVSRDPRFDPNTTREFLETLQPLSLSEVPNT